MSSYRRFITKEAIATSIGTLVGSSLLALISLHYFSLGRPLPALLCAIAAGLVIAGGAGMIWWAYSDLRNHTPTGRE